MRRCDSKEANTPSYSCPTPPPALVNPLKKCLQVLGNPSGEVLGKFKRNGAAHVDFNFAPQKGIGVSQLIPHAPPECVDLITKVGSIIVIG